jgi:hypothetical protein
VDIEAQIKTTHRRGKKFDSGSYVECAADELDGLERAYINEFLPPYNRDGITNSRRKAQGDAKSLPSTASPALCSNDHHARIVGGFAPPAIPAWEMHEQSPAS